MKKIKMLEKFGAAGLLLLALVSSATAQVAITSGSYTINLEFFSSSTLSTAPEAYAPGGLQQNTGANTGPDETREDTWGIFQIIDIKDGSNTVFTQNQGVEYWGVFYNSVDQSTPDITPPTLEFLSRGLKIDIFRLNIFDIDGADADTANDDLWEGIYNQGIGGRTGFGQYNGITNAPGAIPVFSASLTSGTDMFSGFNTVTGATNASGFLTSSFNTLLVPPAGQAMSDIFFSLTGATESSANPVPSDWTVDGLGNVKGSFSAVPEPSTYGLMGATALLGMVALRRFKKRNQAV